MLAGGETLRSPEALRFPEASEVTRRPATYEQARIEELAEQFDRTDVGDSEEFEEVEDVVVGRRPELAQISVRIPPEDLAALRQQAEHAGIGYTTLIRMIIRDHLNSSHGAKRRLSV